ncbi:hypothetical protein CVT25_000050 [Psilocybe cyanescens]|uniref:Glutamine amidotransferase domain-containing protein n=1 Tax=Psilocybe cyanescens TaxID=93625 RepID=A0A409X8L2_PSICY|nr:hypothetical protein CVT25_000050 [Psilocybe cyanescens]
MPPKIALLLCGNLTGKPYADSGGYEAIYSRFLHATVPASPDTEGSSLPFTVDYYDVVHEMVYPKHDDEYDCIMLTGSGTVPLCLDGPIHNRADGVPVIEQRLLHTRMSSGSPSSRPIQLQTAYQDNRHATIHLTSVPGICFGHQIIARAMGGECVPNGGIWEVGPTRIQLTDLGKQIFGSLDTLTIQQMHRDHVPAVPPNFHLLASTDISPNQGTVLFYPEDSGKSKAHIHILTVQGHPEFTEPVVTSIIEQRAASGVINAQAVKDAEARRFVETNAGTIVGKAIWEVILDKI